MFVVSNCSQYNVFLLLRLLSQIFLRCSAMQCPFVAMTCSTTHFVKRNDLNESVNQKSKYIWKKVFNLDICVYVQRLLEQRALPAQNINSVVLLSFSDTWHGNTSKEIWKFNPGVKALTPKTSLSANHSIFPPVNLSQCNPCSKLKLAF